MSVENEKKSIKNTILWKSSLVVLALLVSLFRILGEAAPLGQAGSQAAIPPLQVTTRPLSEFLDAQGTTSPKFFPPVANYVGWTDNPATLFALIDYAGLADDYLGGQLGTQVTGSVTETELPDGRAQVTVNLFTTNALGFAQSVADLENHKFKFKNTPTIFGNKAKDVRQGAEAAVGQSSFFVTFTIASPGAPLPDLVDVLVNHPEEFGTIDVDFTATIPGRCEHGTRAVLHVVQTGPPGGGGTEIVEILSEPCT